ncbi:MAG: alpha/beta hydrolase [Candidatus Melainabacteria bacterium]|nr:alpha/beta hydrolase [Candidatus Melainabacteria bacterium]
MKTLIFALCAAFIFSSSGALALEWQPAAGYKQVPIWPGKAPDAVPTGPERVETVSDKLVGGKTWIYSAPVSRPTITVYSPKGKNTGAAMVVFPGGGYQILAMDLEGTEICDWLTSRGITAVLLKYRVPGVDKFPKSGHYPKSKIALQDAQRALSLVRARAAEYHIDPHKIGVIGFSAGGHLVAATSTQFGNRLYKPVDAADKVSCRPDFGVAIYPGHLWVDQKKFELFPYVPVTTKTPPQFLLQCEDDKVDPPEHSLVYYRALKKAGVPVEMHLYAKGGHAFGLRRTKEPVTRWTDLVETWLGTIGMTPEK